MQFFSRMDISLSISLAGDSARFAASRANPKYNSQSRVREIADSYAKVIVDFAGTADLIGHSFGGLIVQNFWARYCIGGIAMILLR